MAITGTHRRVANNGHQAPTAAVDANPADVPDKTPPNRRLYVLDLLRFGAASLVLMFHLMPIAAAFTGHDWAGNLWTDVVYRATRYGWIGVHLFFLISGFVICMSSWGRTVSQFFVSRVARLWPAFVVAVLLTAAVKTLWPAGAAGPPILDVAVNLTMVPDLLGVIPMDGVYWTLLAELKFYLLFSAVVWAGLTYRRVVAFCGVWIIAAMFAAATGDRVLVEVFSPSTAPYFVAGVVLYLIYRFGPNLMLWCMLAVSWVLCARVFHKKETTEVTWKALVLLAVLFLIMLAVALGWLSWIRWRRLTVLGALSYPMYLLHDEIGGSAFRELGGAGPWWVVSGCIVAGVLVAAYLIQRFVERPVSPRLRRGLRAGLDRAPGSGGGHGG